MLVRKLTAVSSQIVRHQSTIGFVGLGNMGGPMAMNLIKNNVKVVGFDVSDDACRKIEDAGGEIASSPRQVAMKCDKIVTMLPNSTHVKEVYMGEEGILREVKENSLLIDSSTIDPAVSKLVAVESKKKQATYMDAPVSGGVPAATNATLTFMVGGDKFPQTEEILQMMGGKIVHCGGVGTGQAAKLCNNMLLATSMIATAESMNMGVKLGLDPKLLASIMGSSSGRCWSVDTYNPVPGVMETVPSSNHYNGGFASKLMLKDLKLCEEAAVSSGSFIEMARKSVEIYERICENERDAARDFSSVYEHIMNKE